jgi:hypothetical protein
MFEQRATGTALPQLYPSDALRSGFTLGDAREGGERVGGLHTLDLTSLDLSLNELTCI